MKVSKRHKNGRVLYCADFRDGAGRRVQRFFDDEQSAREYLHDLRGYGAVAALTAAERAEFAAARERLKLSGATIGQAVEFFIGHHRPAVRKSLADGVRECILAKVRSGVRARYAQQFGYVLNAFIKDREAELVSSVESLHVEEFIAKPAWSQWRRKTVLADLSTFFAFALKRGWCVRSPVAAVEPVRVEDKPPAILTPGQVADLFAECAKRDCGLIPYFTLAVFAGIRPAEALRLRWEHVQIDRGFVEVTADRSKTRQRRIVQLSANAAAWLRLGGDLPVVNWQRRFRKITRKAGVPWSQDCLRHSFASYHLAAHGSADKTATQLGHESTAMLFRHYRELVTPEAAREFWAIFPADGLKLNRRVKAATGDREHYRAMARRRWAKARAPSSGRP